MRHKCPEIAAWVEERRARGASLPPLTAGELRAAEVSVLRRLVDLLVYVLDPTIYDAQPFLGWDSWELTALVDFSGKTVIDVGAGTGRLSFVAAAAGAAWVYAVEPVTNLRQYMREKACRDGFTNFSAVDGTITSIPFPAGFADVVMGGHVFGDCPEPEMAELERVTCPGGMIVLCPGNNAVDNAEHAFLTRRGFSWSAFEEPRDGMKRKYWRVVGVGEGDARSIPARPAPQR
jgi:SAM-dependent methyltransferase